MKYYIIAGEASGDIHGSNLIKELKKLDNNAEFRAWGGNKMEDAGAYIIKNYKDHNYMGFVEVIIHIRKILKNISFCKKDIENFKPDVLILIDYPGFNLRIAKWAKKNNIKIAYYISPQVWAWKSSRVDKMIVILPFEKDFYAKYNYDVEYVGHPLLDEIETTPKDQNQNIITILPGSRKQEIKRILPIMTSIIKYFPNYKFVVAGVNNFDIDFYKKYSKADIEIEYNKLYKLLSKSKASIVTSGTATLETALNNVPLVVCYKSSLLSYHIAKKLIKVKYISLVNLIMNKPIVKELIQNELNETNLKEELEKLLTNNKYRDNMFDEYNNLRKILKSKGASEKTAKIINNMIAK